MSVSSMPTMGFRAEVQRELSKRSKTHQLEHKANAIMLRANPKVASELIQGSSRHEVRRQKHPVIRAVAALSVLWMFALAANQLLKYYAYDMAAKASHSSIPAAGILAHHNAYGILLLGLIPLGVWASKPQTSIRWAMFFALMAAMAFIRGNVLGGRI